MEHDKQESPQNHKDQREGQDPAVLHRTTWGMISAMTRPPTAPNPRIGPQAFVMTAEGALKSTPINRPTIQPGQVRSTTPMTNPIAKRSRKAAVSAARLSG